VTDYSGIALVIAAGTGAVSAIGTLVLSALTFARQGARDAKIADLHGLINGVSHELASTAKRADFAEGKEAGTIAEQERTK
jgi:hypothetical protein